MALELEYVGFLSLALLLLMLATVAGRSLRDRRPAPSRTEVHTEVSHRLGRQPASADGEAPAASSPALPACMPPGGTSLRPGVPAPDASNVALPAGPGVAPRALAPRAAAAVRIMIFIDWPNFAQEWLVSLDRTQEQRAATRAAFERLPYDLIDVLEAAPELAGAGPDAKFEFAGAHVYDSFISDLDLLLAGVTERERLVTYRGYERQLLETGISTIPGFAVHISNRKVSKKGRGLDATVFRNASGLVESEEKEVDTALTADLCKFAAIDRYDVALLLSDDRDYRPGVRVVQDTHGKKVVHVGFSNTPVLRTECWGFIAIDVGDEEEGEPTAAIGRTGDVGAAGAGTLAASRNDARVRPAHLRAGQNYEGKVRELVHNGAWIDLPGQGRYGFLSIRNIRPDAVTEIRQELREGQTVWVKFIGADKNRRIQLSMKDVDQPTGRDHQRD